jgi:hypothetical protein
VPGNGTLTLAFAECPAKEPKVVVTTAREPVPVGVELNDEL